MKNIYFRVLIFIIGTMALIFSLSSCQKATKDIEIIIIRNYIREVSYEDKIDLTNKQYWESGPLDRSEEVEKYNFVCDLDDKKITEFLLAAKEHEFLSWEEEYRPDQIICDGVQWKITIYFTDSTDSLKFQEMAEQVTIFESRFEYSEDGPVSDRYIAFLKHSDD